MTKKLSFDEHNVMFDEWRRYDTFSCPFIDVKRGKELLATLEEVEPYQYYHGSNDKGVWCSFLKKLYEKVCKNYPMAMQRAKHEYLNGKDVPARYRTDSDDRILTGVSVALQGSIGQEDDVERLMQQIEDGPSENKLKAACEIAVAFIRFAQDLKRHINEQ